MKISGKTVLLTGGTNGIGKALAFQMREAGVDVVVTGRNAERVAAMRGEGFEVIEAGLSDSAGVDGLIGKWGDRALDILINNAGQLVDHDFRKTAPDPDAVDDAIYANLNAPIRLTTALMDQLKARPEAAIVNVTSGLAIAPAARQPVYCATKAGLRFYTLALREQLKDTHIKVIEALPPVVDTQMNENNPMKKMSVEECAGQILEAIVKDREEANIGMTKALRFAESLSPALAKRVTLRF